MNLRYQELVDTLYGRFGLPVTLDDAHFRMLAFSDHPHEQTDAARQDAVLRRPGDPAVRRHFEQHMRGKDDFGRIPANADLGFTERTFAAVRWRDRTKGYVFMLDPERVISRESFDDFREHFAAVASEIELARFAEKRMAGAVPSLLIGEARERDLAAELLEAPGERWPNGYRVVVVQSPAGIEAPEAIWTRLFHREFAWGRVGDQTVAIVRGSAQSLLDRIRDGAIYGGFLPDARPIAAAGGVVDRLEDAHRSYREALLTLQVLASRAIDSRTMEWELLGAWRPLVLLGRDAALRCVDSRLVELLQSSSRTTLRFLHRYLERESDVTTLAIDFNLHRATVYSRLRRLQARYGLSWDDPEDRLACILGVRIALLYSDALCSGDETGEAPASRSPRQPDQGPSRQLDQGA